MGTARARAAEPEPSPRPRARPSTARPAPAPRTRRPPAARPRARAAAPPRARLRGAHVVIPIIAVILGGIVWVNVATLSLTHRTTQVIQHARAVESETARLDAVFARKRAAVRPLAEERLGMVEPDAGSVRYLDPVTTP